MALGLASPMFLPLVAVALGQVLPSRPLDTCEEHHCPIGWTASPKGCSWGFKCYRATPALSSHDGCAALCTEKGERAGLACVGSMEEARFVSTLFDGRSHWIGMYRNPARTESSDWTDAHWAAHDQCGPFANWGTAQPDSAYGQEDCVVMTSAATWDDIGCSRREFQCLCELGATTSDEYPDEVASLISSANSQAWATAAAAFRAYLLAIAVPVVAFLAWSITEAIDYARTLNDQVPTSISGRTLRRLRQARWHFLRLRLRTSHSMTYCFSLGWLMH